MSIQKKGEKYAKKSLPNPYIYPTFVSVGGETTCGDDKFILNVALVFECGVSLWIPASNLGLAKSKLFDFKVASTGRLSATLRLFLDEKGKKRSGESIIFTCH